MDIKLQRGVIEEVSAPDKSGAISCRMGPYRLKAPAIVAHSFSPGDEVMVAAQPMKEGVLHVLAVKNYSHDKTARVDITRDLMIFAVAAYIFVLCGIFGGEGIGGPTFAPVQDVASAIGFVIAWWAMRRVIITTRADRWLNYAQLAEET